MSTTVTINPVALLPAPWGELASRLLGSMSKKDRQMFTGVLLVGAGLYVLSQVKG